ncbi:DegT/DnrJ/EryC1/StrS family aminotransferase [Syntrophomonas wolfei]|jgi:dTDP-4-amino-4,6-dideoxygalactose transaminase|uniref:DegT/DnrJ/EryC1/StrS family aminotransferase n=1 Tax=Syntrophomonas wolfei TaxID=863 RepID=UPI00077316A7|nr:DegT/DnrJ/EryC1/StrS family aminotransferase [Syntrophomonas wolfei]
MHKLAINGGEKVRTSLFPAYKVIGEEEIAAVKHVLESGVLSRFLGTWHEDFYGGPQVRALEAEWAEYFEVKHAIAVNSATSGLYCAMGATGVGPGDEVIVSPYTMTASAAAVLVYNAVPVFADIEEDCFCLEPHSVEQRITPYTRAVIVVDIFGQPYDADRINAIAQKHNLLVIEDAAQAPGARYKGKWAGTLGDIGVFSLNYHKHIHSGEGGIVVTDNNELAERVRLIRNHAEAVVENKGYNNLINMLGFNYRMTEVEAAIAREQLKKLKGLLKQRRENVIYLEEQISRIPCLQMPAVRDSCQHSYYVHALKFKSDMVDINRELFINAVKAELMPVELRESEGVNVGCGYVKPLYLQPLYQQQVLYGDKGCPFNCPHYEGTINYRQGLCPVCEKMHYEELITHELIRPPMSKDDLNDVGKAFAKVWRSYSNEK